MSESFEQLLDAEEMKDINVGDIVEGTVISVKEDEIVLDIKCKSEGIITIGEFTSRPNVDLTKEVKLDDKIKAIVVKKNDGEGQVVLSVKRLAARESSKRIEEAYNNKEVLKAVVSQVREGGLTVVVEETEVFIPASLVSDMYEKDLSKYNGQEIEFVITEYVPNQNPRKRRIIGNRKQLVVAEKEAKQKEVLDNIKVGDVVKGKVKNITSFGAFIDLGGIDGLLHISEMSWGRVDNPAKLFNVDDEIDCLVKEINGKKIALSLKFENSNPWLNAADKYGVGAIVTGKVARMTDFCAFVELEPGIDALLHVSQISKERVEKPEDVLKIGQEIEAKVVDFKPENKKISLSIKALLANDDAEVKADEEEVKEEV